MKGKKIIRQKREFSKEIKASVRPLAGIEITVRKRSSRHSGGKGARQRGNEQKKNKNRRRRTMFRRIKQDAPPWRNPFVGCLVVERQLSELHTPVNPTLPLSLSFSLFLLPLRFNEGPFFREKIVGTFVVPVFLSVQLPSLLFA